MDMWRDIRRRALAVLLLAAPAGGCLVRDRTVTCPPAQVTTQVANSGCVWVQPYRDAAGRIHAAHWRCPGTIDAY